MRGAFLYLYKSFTACTLNYNFPFPQVFGLRRLRGNPPRSLWLQHIHRMCCLTRRAHTASNFSVCAQSALHQADNLAKLWFEFLSVSELIAQIFCAVSDCENKCGFWQSPQKCSFLFRGFPRYALNDDVGDWLRRNAVWAMARRRCGSCSVCE